MQDSAQRSKNGCLEQILDFPLFILFFHSPLKFYATHKNYEILSKITSPPTVQVEWST
jgi:hypothetical protein